MIKCFIGDIGSGKTLSLIRDIYKNHYLKGNTIYTNVGIKFPNQKNVKLMDKDFLKQFSEKSVELQNACVIIDEAHIFMDSRRSMSSRNIAFTKFVTQSRKKSVDLYITTQDKSPEHFMKSGQVELRIRKLTDQIIFCETFCKIDNRWYKNNTDYVKDNKLYVYNYIFDSYLDPVKKSIFIGNEYYDFYDTNQIIDIF